MSRPYIDLPSPNWDERSGGADMLVLHYTGMQTAQAALDRLRDPEARVSSHYVVDEDGSVFRLVPEARRAWHAGVSYWRGRRALNDVSIGIEIVNPGHEWGYRAFPDSQMNAVRALCRDILARWPIPAAHVVGHSDIAPTRKQDPGELFPWAWLAAEGIGVWPEAGEVEADTAPEAALVTIGYDSDGDGEANLRAFQRHWLPEEVTGVLSAATLARLGAVCGAMRRMARAGR